MLDYQKFGTGSRKVVSLNSILACCAASASWAKAMQFWSSVIRVIHCWAESAVSKLELLETRYVDCRFSRIRLQKTAPYLHRERQYSNSCFICYLKIVGSFGIAAAQHMTKEPSMAFQSGIEKDTTIE